MIAFVLVALAVYLLERQEVAFFSAVQTGQSAEFARMQEEFARQQEEHGRSDLLLVNEANHVNLTRLFANVLWNDDFAPFIAKASNLAARCSFPPGQTSTPTDSRRACEAATRAQIMATPEFPGISAQVAALTKGTTVFKIKVFDPRGMTVYSSELSQIGEDKADNLGWKSAIDGMPASELTHRNKFSAFEGVVENRDLISSYVPVHARDGKVIGVFEIYSDVTPFLDRIKEAAAETSKRILLNQQRVERAAANNQEKLESSSLRLLAIVGGLFALFYGTVLLLVRNGQRIMDEQAQARERSVLREARWHREKMTALATMSASIAHEIGNPLAVIAGNAAEMTARQEEAGPGGGQPQAIMEQVHRISSITRRMTDFVYLRGTSAEPVDVNHMVQAVCDFLAFDRRFRNTSIEFHPADGLPTRTLIPDHLNEALMNLLEAWVEVGAERGPGRGRMVVRTAICADDVVISIEHDSTDGSGLQGVGIPLTDPRFESARRRIAGLGGRMVSTGTTLKMHLPPVRSG